jgi:phosphoribosyl-AMP cyclohydrolase / phosphoribosyl-ATP pyrophosphohydrolase
MLDLTTLDFEKGSGLVTVVAQDAGSGAVLMVAHADREALERTLATGEMHYHSRTRGLWHKGATSGNVQRVVSLLADCDGDAVLARVVPAGPACHTGAVSCFGGAAMAADVLGGLDATIAERMAGSRPVAQRGRGAPPGNHDSRTDPGLHNPGDASRSETPRGAAPVDAPAAAGDSAAGDSIARRAGGSYTQRLLGDRNLRLKKIGEEAAELVTACADGDAGRAAAEGADLLYHALVALHAVGVTLDDVRRVLAERADWPHRRAAAPRTV